MTKPTCPICGKEAQRTTCKDPRCKSEHKRRAARVRYRQQVEAGEPIPGKNLDLTCLQCGETFVGRSRQRFCSTRCREAEKAASGQYLQAAKAAQDSPIQYIIPLALLEAPKPIVDLRSEFHRAVDEQDAGAVMTCVKNRSEMQLDGCWKWRGKLDRDGYAIVRWTTAGKRKSFLVHRLVLNAKLQRPLGTMTAHHMCAHTWCVNPDHLQAATHRENIGEMFARTALEARVAELEAALRAERPDHPLLLAAPVVSLTSVG